MRLTSLLLIFSSTAFIGLGLHAVASDRTYDRTIEQAVLKKLKTKMSADIRGSIDFQNEIQIEQNQFADDQSEKQTPPSVSNPHSEQANSELEPMVANEMETEFGIDRTTTASIKKPAPIRVWDRFDKDGNYIDPFTPNR